MELGIPLSPTGRGAGATGTETGIPIKQRINLQLRADAFNLLDTPQFGFPNANIGSPTAGRITTTVGDNRQMQFAAKLDW